MGSGRAGVPGSNLRRAGTLVFIAEEDDHILEDERIVMAQSLPLEETS